MGVLMLVIGAIVVIGLMVKLGFITERYEDMCSSQNLKSVNQNVYRDKKGRYKSKLK